MKFTTLLVMTACYFDPGNSKDFSAWCTVDSINVACDKPEHFYGPSCFNPRKAEIEKALFKLKESRRSPKRLQGETLIDTLKDLI